MAYKFPQSVQEPLGSHRIVCLILDRAEEFYEHLQQSKPLLTGKQLEAVVKTKQAVKALIENLEAVRRAA